MKKEIKARPLVRILAAGLGVFLVVIGGLLAEGSPATSDFHGYFIGAGIVLVIAGWIGR